MSTPEGAGGAPRLDRVHLLVNLGGCLAGWQRALAQGTEPGDPSMTGLRGFSADLRSRLPAVGFGGIAYHLGELMRRFDARGSAGDLREPLDALFDLSEQARLTLTAHEQALLARTSSAPQDGAQASPAVAIVAPTPPPMITGGGPHGVNAVGGEPWRVQSAVVSSSGPPSVKPPRLLDSGIIRGRGPAGSPANLPSFVAPGVGLPPHGPEPLGPAGPLPALGAAGAAHQPGVPAVPLASPPMQVVNPGPQAKPPNLPNLLVRSMLGLRPFRGREPQAGSAPVPPKASESGEHGSSLLGLKRRVSSSGVSASPATPPPLLDRGPSGLPPLPPRPSAPPRSEVPPSGASENASGARNVHDLLSGIERSRGRRGDPARAPALLRHRHEEGQGWRVVAIAVAVLALAFGGLLTLIVVLTRRAEESGGARATSLTASAPSGNGLTTASSGELPRARLLDDNESFRALIAQVHGRGKESPQLRALLDEQAALAARAVSPQKCEGSPAACQAWAKIRESTLGGEGVKRITRRRAAGSPDRVRSRWLVGLKMPEIPIEDDPRVQRWFEYYSEGAVGRELFQAMLFRCGAYRDLIQSTLIRYGLPADLLAIVFVESGCEPQATSPVGAAGLWQFMPAVGRAYHLQIKEGVIDERRSPPKSTDAAVRFLRDLRDKLAVYESQGVWDLVFASYNLGPFGMVARLERAGGDVGFWDLVDADLLPDETAQYTPTIQAVALILNNLQRLKFAGVQMRTPQLTSDLEVPPGTRLSLVARAASTSVIYLRSLNLDISGETTPDVPNFAVQVPKDVIWQARDTLKELMARRDDLDQCMPQDFDWGRQRFSKELAEACRRKLHANLAPASGPSR
jgi:hypothetical protein